MWSIKYVHWAVCACDCWLSHVCSTLAVTTLTESGLGRWFYAVHNSESLNVESFISVNTAETSSRSKEGSKRNYYHIHTKYNLYFYSRKGKVDVELHSWFFGSDIKLFSHSFIHTEFHPSVRKRYVYKIVCKLWNWPNISMPLWKYLQPYITFLQNFYQSSLLSEVETSLPPQHFLLAPGLNLHDFSSSSLALSPTYLRPLMLFKVSAETEPKKK